MVYVLLYFSYKQAGQLKLNMGATIFIETNIINSIRLQIEFGLTLTILKLNLNVLGSKNKQIDENDDAFLE